MKIAIDVSPLESGHKVRGVGFYLKNLKESLVKNFPKHTYTFFKSEKDIPQHVQVIHYPYFDPFFLTLPLRKQAKTVITIHDLTPLVFPQAFPAGLKGKLKWKMQKLALKQVDQIIADSEASKNDILRLAGVPKHKVHVVYLAAGEEFVPRPKNQELVALKKKYDLPDKYLLYVGDVTWNKNLPRLLDAVSIADVPLVMIGKALTERDFDYTNPWNADRIQIQEKAAQNPAIHLLGFLPSEDVVGLMNAATALVLPSLYEGFGLPILEAMSCGTPVITTREGSLPEVAGDAAYFVDAYDEKDMAKGISEVFTNPELQAAMSKKGLAQAKKFSWKKTAEETMRVYELAVRGS